MTYQSSQFRGNFLVMLQYAKITSFACWLYRWDMLVHFILAHVSLLYLQPQVSKPLMFHIWFKLLHLVQPAIRHIKTSVISSSSFISLQSEHQSTCWSWLFNYPEKKLSIKHPPKMRCVVIQITLMMPPLPPANPRLIMEFTQDRMSCSATITDMGLFSYHGRAILVAWTC